MKQILAFLNMEFLLKEGGLRNWRLIFTLSLLAMIMIESGHRADRKIFEIAQLNEELKALKSQFVENRSNLMRLKMETKVAAVLEQNGVKPSEEPPMKIIID
ncbi:MAG: FtsL-like putative cell division protein [Flavobacteriaceae bacterium]